MAVRFFYDLQKLRIQTGNRGKSETADLEEDDQSYMEKASEGLNALERGVLKEVNSMLKDEPIWNEFLKGVKGCGPTMAGVIISEIDIERSPTASALWSYCGLAVNTETGKAVRRKRGEKANWNPFLKTKMVGVLADCFLRSGSSYKKLYDDYKHRWQSEGKGESDGHRHNAAKRYMIKIFLLDLYNTWRQLEGLPIREPYAAEFLGKKHNEGKEPPQATAQA
jgi:hypothetical protein